MTTLYTHDLHNEVRSISGGYTLDEEGTIEIGGRQVIYAVGNAILDSACCGAFGCRFAVVPGYVVRPRFAADDRGCLVSEVEPIRDAHVKEQLAKLIQKLRSTTQVVFW
jgi:hypothetical protein